MRNQALLLVVLSMLSWSAEAQLVRSGTGINAAALTPTRDQFRLDLGGGAVNNGGPGQFIDANGVRREINWDAVPAQFDAPNNLPANFFNSNSPRGAVFSTPGTGFQLSGAPADNLAGQPALDFSNIDPSYPATFEAFSPSRLFTALGSNSLDVNFFVAGTSTPAVTRGFGAVFSDVDLTGPTTITLFGLNANDPLGTFIVPGLSGNATFSFLGVSFPTPIINRVRIISGNAALGAGVLDQNGNPNDLVVMDDFLYAEPISRAQVPIPATLWLFATALPLLAWMRRRQS